MNGGFVYIMTDKKRGTLYIGVTSELIKRTYEHKNGITKGFTSKYNLKKLVYYESFDEIGSAIEYEKKLKNWRRDWKINLIERDNPHWENLYEAVTG